MTAQILSYLLRRLRLAASTASDRAFRASLSCPTDLLACNIVTPAHPFAPLLTSTHPEGTPPTNSTPPTTWSQQPA